MIGRLPGLVVALSAVASCNVVLGLDPYRPCQGAECGAGVDASQPDTAATCACLGGPCVAGACVAEQLLGSIGTPTGIASDSSNLFFSQGDSIRSCQVDGCSGVSQPLLAFSAPLTSQLATNNGSVYFGAQGTVQVAQTSAPAKPKQITTTPNTPTALVICGDRVCWIDSSGPAPQLMSCPLAGCAQPTPLLTLPTAAWTGSGALASDGTNVYVATSFNPNMIVSCPTSVSCSTPTILGYSFDVHGLWFYGGKVYWTANSTKQDGSIGRCDPTSCKTTTEVVATGLPAPWNVVADEGGVYWTSYANPGQVLRCPPSGCSSGVTVLASGQAGPTQIVVDDKRIYWLNSGAGQIMWVAK